MQFHRIEPPYTSPDGCRLVWRGIDEDDEHVVILNKEELNQLIEILKNNTTGKIELQDQVSRILVNSDVTEFDLAHGFLPVQTTVLRRLVLEYAKVLHQPQLLRFSTREFYHRYEAKQIVDEQKKDRSEISSAPEQSLLQAILSLEPYKPQEYEYPDLFRVFATRRSTRRFERTRVEEWKVDKILAAADTAPTVGNFQAFQVFYIKNSRVKEALVEAANNQPYVNAPIVLVFFIDPARIKMKFPSPILEKFSLQDATLAASYAQLAASGVGLSSIWIGMINEEEVKSILGTDLRPSSILCVGYPAIRRPPKSRRKLRELIKVVE